MALVVVVLWGCGGADRPTADTWEDVWTSRQALVPTADAIVRQGEALCGERLGRFRSEMPALLPAPYEALDAVVKDWIAHAETTVFECPTDPVELDDRLATLDVLAAEVDAGLAAEIGG